MAGKRPSLGTALGRLLKLAAPEKRLLIIGTICLVIGSGSGLLFPLGIRYVIDIPLGDVALPFVGSVGRARMLTIVVLAMASTAAIQAVASAARFYLFTVAGERSVTRLRGNLYRRILGQEVAFFDGERTGDLMNRLSADTGVLQSAVSSNISMVLRNLAQAVGGIALLFYTSPRLALVMLAVVPAIAVGAVVYGRRVRRLAKQVQDALAVASSVAEESIGGLRTVRAFAAEPAEAKRYDAANDKSFDIARRRALQSGLFIGIVSFAGYAAAALVFWYGGNLVLDGKMTAGQLTSFLVYTLFVGFSLGSLADLWADFLRSIGAAQRVFELLERDPVIPISGGKKLLHVEGRIELAGVDFAYPTRAEVPVLRELSLALAPGEVVAVVGPSGAGKSTIASLLMRFYDPQKGSVRLEGEDLRELDPSWLRRLIGTVAQEPLLFSTSIADNIRYGRPEASDQEVEAAARAANAESFIRAFPDGFATQVGERGVQLSGGQKQRVAIARAVLKDPRILILDEATSALDAESESLVKDALDRLMKGRTTLIIAHRLSTVIDADRVVVLDGGRVVQAGSHQALMAEGGLYRRLVEKQFVAA
jgi:ATP-binding cassette subfamily B protein